MLPSLVFCADYATSIIYEMWICFSLLVFTSWLQTVKLQTSISPFVLQLWLLFVVVLASSSFASILLASYCFACFQYFLLRLSFPRIVLRVVAPCFFAQLLPFTISDCFKDHTCSTTFVDWVLYQSFEWQISYHNNKIW